jgi:CheY-like chemotaxis protein
MAPEEQRHILIVEDDEAIREAVCDVLRDAGYIVFAVPNGGPALEHLRTSAQAMVVLLDAHMPTMNGMTLLQAVIQDQQLALRCAFVLVTAIFDSLPPQDMRLLKSLSIPVLAKPFDLDDLLAAVQNAMRTLDARSRSSSATVPASFDTDI